MHHISRLALLFCLLPYIGTAQSWSGEVKAGVMWNSKTTKPAVSEASSPALPCLAVAVIKRRGLWEAGLSAGIYRFANRIRGPFVFGPNPTNGEYVTRNINYLVHADGLGLKLSVNRYFDTGRLSLYAGLSPAYYFFSTRDVYYDIRQDSKAVNDKAYGLELHGGATYRLSDGLLLLAEPSLGFINIATYSGRAYALAASLSLGVRIAIRK